MLFSADFPEDPPLIDIISPKIAIFYRKNGIFEGKKHPYGSKWSNQGCRTILCYFKLTFPKILH